MTNMTRFKSRNFVLLMFIVAAASSAFAANRDIRKESVSDRLRIMVRSVVNKSASPVTRNLIPVATATGTARCGTRVIQCLAARCDCMDGVGCIGYDSSGRLIPDQMNLCSSGYRDDGPAVVESAQ